MADRDDRPKPALGRLQTPPPVPRQDPRDFTSRPKSHPLGVPTDFGDGPREITGVYRGEDLRRERARRLTPERIERLEDKHDALHEVVTETRVIVGRLDAAVPRLEQAIERIADRADLEHAAKLEDSLDARKARRARITSLITRGLALVTSGAVLHYLAGRL